MLCRFSGCWLLVVWLLAAAESQEIRSRYVEVLVSIILLTYQSDDPIVDGVMIHPRCVPKAPMHRAVRSQCSWGRVFVSLEHHWNIRFPAGDDQQAFPARPFLFHFAEAVRREGDIDWHIAFHPYPENLFEPRFCLDKSATDGVGTKRVTFKNLPVLLQFLEQPVMRYQGLVRRVILSEQGFHTPDGPDGEIIQAASYCYAYKLVERLAGIDAFILHRHVDHAGEGGLRLGLRSNQARPNDPRPKKLIYRCFEAADTPDWQTAFVFALPILGVKQWNELPGLRD